MTMTDEGVDCDLTKRLEIISEILKTVELHKLEDHARVLRSTGYIYRRASPVRFLQRSSIIFSLPHSVTSQQECQL